MGSPEHKQKIWNIISEIKTGMLVTDDDGVLRARPMQLVQDEYDGTLWFFTHAKAPKSGEVLANHDVCVCFSDPANDTYVSMSGRGTLSWDTELKDRFWNSTVSTWFPEGKDDANTAMLEIKIDHGEHWKNDDGPIEYAAKMVSAKVAGKTPAIGENEKF